MNKPVNNCYKTMTSRVEMLLGTHAMERLMKIRVIIFGVGGVGSWCAESLIRSGVINLTVVDPDSVCPTNINRQVQATSLNTGKLKVMEIKKTLLEINPEADITARQEAYDETTGGNFDLKSYDYAVDAIDIVRNKVHLIENCVKAGVKIFSSMGAASKKDPSKIKIDLLSNTKTCPLAREVRRGLRKAGVTADIPCVYSDELPSAPLIDNSFTGEICGSDIGGEDDNNAAGESGAGWSGRKKKVNGAVVHITAIFGFTLAGLVINDLLKKNS
jgi:tRNA threonylcarbamoyladenosine dehydratase